MVVIIAHQGAPSPDAPENTLEAFQRAGQIGADGCECDVHLTRDGYIVVIHHRDLARVTNGGGDVREYTLRKLKTLNIKGNFKIPTLKEVLELNIPLLFIELKSAHNKEIYPGLVKGAVSLINYLKIRKEKVIFLSFNAEYLAELNNFPFRKMLLSKTFPDIEGLRDFKLYGLAIEHTILNREKVKLAHEKGLKVFAWTVNREDDIREVIDWGVDYICSDDPVLVKKIAAEK